MKFMEKLKMVQKLFDQTCTCFIVFGENILVTSKGACFVTQQDFPEDYEKVSQIFSLSDCLADSLGKYWREAFSDSIVIGSSQFYVADVWEARLIVAEVSLQKKDWKLKWVEGELIDILNSLAWLNPMNPHMIALKANMLFNKELYAVYDIIRYCQAFDKYDVSMIIELIRRRYIAISSLPVDILSEVNNHLEDCELTEYDIISFFQLDLEATGDKVRVLDPKDILAARIEVISTFNNKINKLLTEAGIDVKSKKQYKIVDGYSPDILDVPDERVESNTTQIVSANDIKQTPISEPITKVEKSETAEEKNVTSIENDSKTISEPELDKTHVPIKERERYSGTEDLLL